MEDSNFNLSPEPANPFADTSSDSSHEGLIPLGPNPFEASEKQLTPNSPDEDTLELSLKGFLNDCIKYGPGTFKDDPEGFLRFNLPLWFDMSQEEVEFEISFLNDQSVADSVLEGRRLMAEARFDPDASGDALAHAHSLTIKPDLSEPKWGEEAEQVRVQTFGQTMKELRRGVKYADADVISEQMSLLADLAKDKIRSLASRKMAAVVLATSMSLGLISGDAKDMTIQRTESAEEIIAEAKTRSFVFYPDNDTSIEYLAKQLKIDPNELLSRLPDYFKSIYDIVEADTPLALKEVVSSVEAKKQMNIEEFALIFGINADLLLSANEGMYRDDKIEKGQLVDIPSEVKIVETEGDLINLEQIAFISGIPLEQLQSINPRPELGYLLLPSNTSDKMAVVLALVANTPSHAPIPNQAAPEAQSDLFPIVKAMAEIDINKESIDISSLVQAAIDTDNFLKTYDQHRLASMPEGYVKIWFHDTIDQGQAPYTIAERTDWTETYTSPEMAALTYATAVLYQQLIETKYPQYIGSMLRVRDGNSPYHNGHNNGTQSDLSSAMSYAVTQYSDGPFGDMNSPNYDPQFTADLLNLIQRLQVNGQPLVRRFIYSDEVVLNQVQLARYAKYHRDHVHVDLNPIFAESTWRPKFNETWGGYFTDSNSATQHDLKIGPEAVPMPPELLAKIHGAYIAWANQKIAEQQANSTTTTSTTTPTTTINPEATKLQPEEIVATLELNAEQKAFLNQASRAIVNVYNSGAKINPEVVLAQVALETGFGTGDTLSKQANNVLGIKAGKGYTGPTINKQTGEQTSSGNEYTVEDDFRVYENIEDCIADYANNLIASRPQYADAVTNFQNPEAYANALIHEVDESGNIIKKQGDEGVLSYSTAPNYAEKLIQIARDYKFSEIVQAFVEPANNRDLAQEPTTSDTQEVAPTSDVIKESQIEIGTKNKGFRIKEEFAIEYIYKPYFTSPDGSVDEVGLSIWMNGLIKVGLVKDGYVIIDPARIPGMDKYKVSVDEGS